MENNDRTSVTKYAADGTVEYIDYGKSRAELKADHDRSECDAMCPFCYADACAMKEGR